MTHYEFQFEGGITYNGTTEDKNDLVRHFTKREREEYGKVISKRKMTDQEWKEYEAKRDLFLAFI